MKSMKKKSVLLVVLAFVMMFGSVVSVHAAIPSISNSKYIRTYPLSTSNNTYVYTNSSLTKRGTSSPYKSYNAVIYASDEIYVYKMTSSYAYISYPTSSGRRYGYIKTSSITSNNFSKSAMKSNATITTYRRAGSTKYGSISKGDMVYAVAQSGNYTQVVYPVGSTYKMGWILTSNYNKYINSSGNTGTNVVNSSTWSYPMTSAYVCGNNWATYYSARPSRPYHVGIDIASSKGDSNVYAAANGTVAKTGYNSSNGYYVIIKHTISSKTVYSFYGHLQKNSICVSQGQYIAKGSKIAIYGNTGSSSDGRHLHFAITDTLSNTGGYYGYVTKISGNKATYNGVTYYNPHYVIKYNKLP